MSKDFHLPPLALPLPRLSETGEIIGGAASTQLNSPFGSPAHGGSISARYAALRAQGRETQEKLTARTPVRPPQGAGLPALSPLKPIQFQSTQTDTSSASRIQPSASQKAMSLETAASEELQRLNLSQAETTTADGAPNSTSVESTLLLLLPGYHDSSSLIASIRATTDFKIGQDERGKELIKKITFNQAQADEFCKQVELAASESNEVKEEEKDDSRQESKETPVDEETEAADEESYDSDAEDQPTEETAAPEPSPQSPSLILHSPPTPQSLTHPGGSIAIQITGVDVVRALTAWLDEQDQRAYLYTSFTSTAAERELQLLFTSFRPVVESTLALIKPDAIASGFYPTILRRIETEGFEIARVEESLRMSEAQAKVFYDEHSSKPFFPLLVKFMSSGPLVALELKRESAIVHWRTVIGSSTEANSLRGLYGTDSTRNAVHGSDSPAAAARELDFIFNTVCPIYQTTFAMIKPEGIKHKNAILNRLNDEGFDLTRIQLVERLTTDQIRTFFVKKDQWQQQSPPTEKTLTSPRKENNSSNNPLSTPRRDTNGASSTLSPASPNPTPLTPRRSADILPPPPPPASVDRPSFEMVLDALQKGPVIAIELKRNQAVRTLRRVAGGSFSEQILDPALARQTDSTALRAVFGENVLYNSLYTSASFEDATRDLSTFFTNHLFYPPITTSFLLIKPDIVSRGLTDELMKRLTTKEGFIIERQKKLLLTPEQLQAIFPGGLGSAASDAIANSETATSSSNDGQDFTTYMTSGPAVALQLKRRDCIGVLQQLVGSFDYDSTQPLDLIKLMQPQSFKALYALDLMMDSVYAASSESEAAKLNTLLFHEWNPVMESTFAMLKPDVYCNKQSTEAIIARIRSEGFEIVRKSKLHFSKEQAKEFYAEHDGRIFQKDLIEFMTSGPCLAFELRKIDAVRQWRQLLGPTNSLVAKKDAPKSIRALFGTDGRRNAAHGSDSIDSATREINLIFHTFVPMIETTCCFLKPETLQNGTSKAIIKDILAQGFEIVKQEKMTLTLQQAIRFYTEHAGALYFIDLLNYMTSGPSIALALRKENAIKDFRAFMGPTDSTVARRTHPQSLRAKYGIDKKFNAVHGSENKESAAREIDLVFGTFSVGVQDTFLWIKPDAHEREAEILQRLQDEGFVIVKQLSCKLTDEQLRIFYEEHSKASFFEPLIKYMSSGTLTGVILRKENAIRALRELAGPTSSIEARIQDPDSLRAIYGTDSLKNAVHASKTLEHAQREIQLVFTQFFVGPQSTLALLKPDAILKQAEGTIIDMIRADGFEIVRKKALSLTTDQAKQFYSVHAGQPFFDGLVEFMTSGPIIALELKRENAIKAWRDLIGPTNSAVARERAPKSIRALFGTDGRQNAAHGSDSVESAQKELALIFDQFSSELLTTLAIIKPDAVKKGVEDVIVKRITDAGFELIARKKLKLTPAQVKQLYLNDTSKPTFKTALEFMTSGPVLCLALRKNNALADLTALVGHENPKVAKKSQPQSIRAQYGTDVNRNAIHAPNSVASNAREVALLFGEFNFDLLG